MDGRVAARHRRGRGPAAHRCRRRSRSRNGDAVGSSPLWIWGRRRERSHSATRSARGCAPTCRGSTGKGLPPRFDDLAEEVAFGREWQAKLASGRWVGVGWPQEYGGRGAGPVEHYIVTEELRARPRPELVGRIGVNLVGPTLLAHGTDDQKERWLPKILDATEIWCQLFSEPGAGSDLTSLQTRAPAGRRRLPAERPEGVDELRAVRRLGLVPRPHRIPTHRSRKGISALVVDMHAPGVEVRPLRQITDETEFNEVFFSDVFVPDDQLVGPRDEGWRIANSTLTHERGVNPRQLVIHSQLVDELLAARGRARRPRRPAPRAAARARPSSRCASSSCTTGARSRGPPRAKNQDRSAASTSCGGAR